VLGERNYNIGDLVINKMPVELSLDGLIIRPGEVGLIISLIPYREFMYHDYDYIVLIQGRDVFFFDHELSPHKHKQDIK